MDKDKTRLRKLDIAFGALCVLLGTAYFLIAFFMPRQGSGSFGGNQLATAPGLLPMVVSAVFVLMSATLVYQALRDGARITREDWEKLRGLWKEDNVRRTARIVLIITVYAFGLLRNLPYILATFLYLAVFMYCFKAAPLRKICIISLVASVAIWFFFGQVALIPLP